MANKKTSKKKVAAKTPATNGKVVFAFRLTPEQRDTIHKAAGPRGASRFVLEAALAAAASTKK